MEHPCSPVPSGTSVGSEPIPFRHTVHAYLELDHLPHVLELGEHVLIEVQELLVGLLFAVLQAGVGVIVIPSALLHSKCCEHASNEERGARCGEIVFT